MNPYHYITDDFGVGLAILRLNREKIITLDTETTGLDPLDWSVRLRLVQLGGRDITYVFDCDKLGLEGKEELRKFFERDDIIFIAHNAKFDIKFIKLFLRVKRVHKFIDTYLAAVLLSCGLFDMDEYGESSAYGFSLEDCCGKYLGIEVDKTHQRSDWSKPELSPSQIKYAAYDSEVLRPLWAVLSQELVRQGQAQVARLEFDAVPAVAGVELAGFHLEPDRWSALCEENQQEWKRQRLELQEMLAYTPKNGQLAMFGSGTRLVNLDSQPQLVNALLAQGVPVPTNDETGHYTTSKFKMNALAIDYPIINFLRKYRILEKHRSSYGLFWLDLIHPYTGRLHMDFKQIGAKTGRMAVSRLQQVPADPRYRRCFTAARGRKLVRGDYAQFELRILADLSQDPGLVEAFFKGLDLHQYTADRVGRPRAVARNMNYAIPYGSGPMRFSLMCEPPIPLSEAKAIFAADQKAFPKKHAWLEQAGRDAVKFKQSRTRSGRLTKYIYDPLDENSVRRTERNGKNTPIQGLNADVTKRAMKLIYDEIQGNSDIMMVHLVHDEILLEPIEEFVPRANELLNDLMPQAAREFVRIVPVKVETHVGNEWSK